MIIHPNTDYVTIPAEVFTELILTSMHNGIETVEYKDRTYSLSSVANFAEYKSSNQCLCGLILIEQKCPKCGRINGDK